MEFRRLVALLTRVPALAAFWTCWRDLGYYAQSTGKPGHLGREEVAALRAEFSGLSFKFSDGDSPSAAAADAIFSSGLLVLQDDGSAISPLFTTTNHRLQPGQQSLATKGGLARGHKFRMQAGAQQALFDALDIKPECLARPDGQPMDHEETRRVKLLVMTFDSALGKPNRAPKDYTPGLCQDAWRVVSRHEAALCDEFAQRVLLNRQHPSFIGMTTEKLLPRFEELLAGE